MVFQELMRQPENGKLQLMFIENYFQSPGLNCEFIAPKSIAEYSVIDKIIYQANGCVNSYANGALQ